MPYLGRAWSKMCDSVGIASPALSVQKLFSLPVSGFHFRFFYRHFAFGCRPMSGGVGSEISKSGMVEHVEVAVGIASPTLSVQTLLPLPVSTSDF